MRCFDILRLEVGVVVIRVWFFLVVVTDWIKIILENLRILRILLFCICLSLDLAKAQVGLGFGP